MDVDSPVSLKRSSSAPMINELNTTMTTASTSSSTSNMVGGTKCCEEDGLQSPVIKPSNVSSGKFRVFEIKKSRNARHEGTLCRLAYFQEASPELGGLVQASAQFTIQEVLQGHHA